MRNLENIIRVSVERLASRNTQGWLTPGRSRALVVSVLVAGFLLVVIWAGALAYFVYLLIALAFA
jgi:hypothetical protein